MIHVVLAGNYPAHTAERLQALLPQGQYRFSVADTQERYDGMTDAQVLILRVFRASKEVMDRNPGLNMIMRWGAGVDSVDLAAAGERGILVTSTPGANAAAVSELAVMMMLAVGRRLLCHTESLNSGLWSKNTYLNSSFCLNGKLVGIIGGGNIGRQVAAKAAAFGARIQYFDPYRLPEETEQALNMRYVSLEELISTSDIITLHIPLLDSTRHIIGEKELAAMKQGAILINTARGGLVDDRALAEAVRRGRLAGAGLDVVEREPLPAGDELLTEPNIIVTPHIGGGTADIADVIIPMLAEDLKTYLDGVRPAHVVNSQYLA